MRPIKQITLLLVLLVQVFVLGAWSGPFETGTGSIREARVLPEHVSTKGGPVLSVLPTNDLTEDVVAAQEADGLSVSMVEGPLDAPCDGDLGDLTDDLGSNPELDDFFKNTPGGVEAWEEIFKLKAHPSLRTNPNFLEDFAKSAAGISVQHIPSGPMVGKKIGHTFSKHGSHNTKTLTYQAVNGNTPIGQWLDDVAAEDFIARHLSQLGQGARDIPIPNSVGGIGRVFKSGTGELVEVTHIRLVPSGSGVDTAFPINDGLVALNPLGTYVP